MAGILRWGRRVSAVTQADIDSALSAIAVASAALTALTPGASVIPPLIELAKVVNDAIWKASQIANLASQTAVKAIDLAVDAEEAAKFGKP
jgi:hypothetical protein